MPSTTKTTTNSSKTAKKPVKKAAAKPEIEAKAKKTVKKAEASKVAIRETKAKAKVAKVPETVITSEDRHRMIAEAAYYLAEKRGFHGGSPENDWLAAAQQIDKMIMGG